MRIEHFYSPVMGFHSVYVFDFDGQQILSVDFDEREACPQDASHEAHEDILDVMKALADAYGVGHEEEG